MTNFARLSYMEKSAVRGRVIPLLWRGTKSLFNDGVWGSAQKLSHKAQARGWGGGRAWGALDNVSGVMRGPTGLILGGYGMASALSSGFGGPRLPGGTIALNVGAPGLGAMFAGAGGIQLARANSDKYRQAAKEDVMSGARLAGADFIDATQAARGNIGLQQYNQFLRDNGRYMDMADQYRTGSYKPMGWMRKFDSLMENPQDIINDRMDREIFGRMQKGANWRRHVWSGAKKHVWPRVKKWGGGALKWSGPVLGVGAIGMASFGKPYNEEEAMSRGYAAGQAGIQTRLGGMTDFERMMLGLDPSLAAHGVESAIPGTIDSMGGRYKPGWISNLTGMSAPDAGKGAGGHTPRYYEMDAAGKPHYF